MEKYLLYGIKNKSKLRIKKLEYLEDIKNYKYYDKQIAEICNFQVITDILKRFDYFIKLKKYPNTYLKLTIRITYVKDSEPILLGFLSSYDCYNSSLIDTTSYCFNHYRSSETYESHDTLVKLINDLTYKDNRNKRYSNIRSNNKEDIIWL